MPLDDSNVAFAVRVLTADNFYTEMVQGQDEGEGEQPGPV